MEKAIILRAVERNHWNVTRAAEEVEMLRPNFQTMVKKYGLRVIED